MQLHEDAINTGESLSVPDAQVDIRVELGQHLVPRVRTSELARELWIGEDALAEEWWAAPPSGEALAVLLEAEGRWWEQWREHRADSPDPGSQGESGGGEAGYISDSVAGADRSGSLSRTGGGGTTPLGDGGAGTDLEFDNGEDTAGDRDLRGVRVVRDWVDPGLPRDDARAGWRVTG